MPSVAVILGQGSGTRLRPLTENVPKNLVPVAGKPILERQLQWLSSYGVDTVHVMASGYSEAWEKWYSEYDGHVNVFLHFRNEPHGTAGCIVDVLHVLPNSFYVLNGDILTNLSLRQLSGLCHDSFYACIALVPLRSPYGVVEVKENLVVGFREKPVLYDYLINAGVYFLRSTAKEYIRDGAMFETDVFPQLALDQRLGYIRYDHAWWKSVDTVKDLKEAEEYYQKMAE